MPQRRYGCKRDLADQRDHYYAAPSEVLQALPPSVDLRPQCPPIYDQGQLGSCVSNAVAGFIQFLQMKEGKPTFMPSRLFEYYNGRLAEGTVMSDSGESVRDGVKSVNSMGICPESEWPYDISQFTVPPPAQCYTDALLTRALQYQRIMQNLNMMLACLASGFPVIGGFTVYESFESAEVASTGIVPMPSFDESVLGGHAVAMVGYDTSKQWFTFRNSWGDQWGNNGYGYLPFAYLTNPQLASDFWTMRLVS